MGMLRDYFKGRAGLPHEDIIPSLPHQAGSADRAAEIRAAAAHAAEQESNGSLFLALLLLPPLIPPAIVIYFLWLSLDSWEFWPKVGIATVAIVIIGLLCRLFFKITPGFFAALITAAYMAGTYGWAASMMEVDRDWTLGIAAIAAIFGLFYGRKMSRRYRY